MQKNMGTDESTQRIPVLIGLVADADADCNRFQKRIEAALKWLDQVLPNTPRVVVSLIQNDTERQLVQHAKRVDSTVRVWHLSGGGVECADTTVDRLFAIPGRQLGAEKESDRQWSQLGWLAGHCHLLLALEGKAVGARARFAHEIRLHSVPPEHGGQRGAFFAPEVGPSVIDSANAVTEGQDFSASIAFPLGRNLTKWSEQLGELDRANRGLIQQKGVVRLRSIEELPDCERFPVISRLFQQLDSMSRSHQFFVTCLHGGTLALGLAAVLFLQWLPTRCPNLPLSDLYALTFMLLGSAHLWVRTQAASDQYADYRVLAEGLRVQYFWLHAGITEAPADHFLHKHHHRLGWVRDALKGVHLYAADATGKPSDVMAEWVSDQAQYHQGSAARNGSLSRNLGRAVKFFYVISLVLTFIVFWLGKSFPKEWQTLLGNALGISASCGTLLLIFNGSMGFGSRAGLHTRMQESFELAKQVLSDQAQQAEHQEILVDLGREAIQETGEWVYVQGPP